MKNNALEKFNIYELIASKLIEYFDKRLELGEEDKQKLYLGIMVIFINLFKMAIVFLAAFYMNTIRETVILFLLFAVLRFHAAGIHLKGCYSCTIVSLITFIGSSIVTIKYPLDMRIVFLINILLMCVLYKYSPADTENKPILGKQHRAKLKRKTIIVCAVLMILNLILQSIEFFNLTMYAFLIQSICVSPITYKLVHQKYDNYKSFEN